MSEVDKIRSRYKKRESAKHRRTDNKNQLFENFRNIEREEKYNKIIFSNYDNVTNLRVLEIGAGYGINISYFKDIGIPPGNIWANELLINRLDILRKNHNDINILPGDARNIKNGKTFDIILQSMVFSSVLENEFRLALAKKLKELLKDDGIILWYDFVYDNPWNKDVRGVKRKEIVELFSGTIQEKYKVTLMPQLARLTGKWYPFFNRSLPFLRTHTVTAIYKNK